MRVLEWRQNMYVILLQPEKPLADARRASQIHDKIRVESYSPRTWRSHPLHICPTEPYAPTEPLNKVCLDWIFLISALNFSFWSERDGCPDRYGVLWQESWESSKPKLWTGYWSLVASLNRG
jgi:hypothetical protein